MSLSVSLVSIVVEDYDEAIDYFVQRLGFRLYQDQKTPEDGKRWVVVGPPGVNGTRLLLAKAKNDIEKSRVGDQTGGRVFLFLYTDDFDTTFKQFRESGVEFIEEPRNEPYGTIAVFKDLYGNRWDLIQPS